MNRIITNRNYYRLTPSGQIPIAILTLENSPVLTALLEESLRKDCHYYIQKIISLTQFSLPSHYNVSIETMHFSKFTSLDLFQKTLLHNLVDVSPEMIALIDFNTAFLATILPHFQGRIVHSYWQEPSIFGRWLPLPFIQKSTKRHQLRIEFINTSSKKGHLIVYCEPEITQAFNEKMADKMTAQAYTAVLDWIGDQRIVLDQSQVYFDGKPLSKKGLKLSF